MEELKPSRANFRKRGSKLKKEQLVDAYVDLMFEKHCRPTPPTEMRSWTAEETEAIDKQVSNTTTRRPISQPPSDQLGKVEINKKFWDQFDEKYCQCRHIKDDSLASGCDACELSIAIERGRLLETALDNANKMIGDISDEMKCMVERLTPPRALRMTAEEIYQFMCARLDVMPLYPQADTKEQITHNHLHLKLRDLADAIIAKFTPPRAQRMTDVQWPEKKGFFTDPKGEMSEHERKGWNACHDAFMKIISELEEKT